MYPYKYQRMYTVLILSILKLHFINVVLPVQADTENVYVFNKQSSSESVVKKAALLGEMHVRSLRQKMMLLQLTEESAKKLEVVGVSIF